MTTRGMNFNPKSSLHLQDLLTLKVYIVLGKLQESNFSTPCTLCETPLKFVIVILYFKELESAVEVKENKRQ